MPPRNRTETRREKRDEKRDSTRVASKVLVANNERSLVIHITRFDPLTRRADRGIAKRRKTERRVSFREGNG